MLPTTSLPTLTVSVDDVLRVQGANPAVLRSRGSSVIALTEKAIQTAERFLQPAVWLSTLPVSGFTHNQVLLENGQILRGGALLQHLGEAHRVAFAIGTLGVELEEQIHQAMECDPTWGYMLDSTGSAYAEALGEWTMAQVRSAAQAEDLSTSMTLMPGHGDWPVDEGQPQIFAVLRPNPAVVRLTESAQMIPRKSFSFIIGLGCRQDDSSPCEFCSLRQSCPMRR